MTTIASSSATIGSAATPSCATWPTSVGGVDNCTGANVASPAITAAAAAKAAPAAAASSVTANASSVTAAAASMAAAVATLSCSAAFPAEASAAAAASAASGATTADPSTKDDPCQTTSASMGAGTAHCAAEVGTGVSSTGKGSDTSGVAAPCSDDGAASNPTPPTKLASSDGAPTVTGTGNGGGGGPLRTDRRLPARSPILDAGSPRRARRAGLAAEPPAPPDDAAK